MLVNLNDSIRHESWYAHYADFKRTIYETASKQFKTRHDIDIWFDELNYLIGRTRSIPERRRTMLLGLSALARGKSTKRLENRNARNVRQRLDKLKKARQGFATAATAAAPTWENAIRRRRGLGPSRPSSRRT